MKRLVRTGFLGALLIGAALAQAADLSLAAATFTYRLDIDSGTTTYCRTVGQNGDPYGGSILGPGRIQTTGSATSVVASVASSAPFIDVGVGDVLVVTRTNGSQDIAVVQTKVNNDSITVDPAVNWTGGFSWRWWDLRCGTGAEDGWISVGPAQQLSLSLFYEQGDLTGGVKARWECREGVLGGQAVVVYPSEGDGCGSGTLTSGYCEFATAPADLMVKDGGPTYSSCRVGVAFVTADPGDAGANLERVTLTTSLVR